MACDEKQIFVFFSPLSYSSRTNVFFFKCLTKKNLLYSYKLVAVKFNLFLTLEKKNKKKAVFPDLGYFTGRKTHFLFHFTQKKEKDFFKYQNQLYNKLKIIPKNKFPIKLKEEIFVFEYQNQFNNKLKIIAKNKFLVKLK